ncbi:bifunctional diaminohydroxyphosphoribosylaminopyrimidine deaminase/5-amino-6-(5-phosphoribosylamino)uracil reductase RibD [Coxiella endosymbiont of Amblyomma sculptum]|uniref:bifunctional diaminohydroxyphosphoribosylaminopyrimidine deaminase/5-amino-6-(5-phosphoribosylamino)uracil reductase RibD n=1 Tax=Coxiella endosymbiont of Amblyomma sculptum TaxID=2487929 RepID=UPI00132F1FCC|nr:bifunctional diaminohydroxyphosphoribosylaminopyrimidine deaminase/5-amino-6-(5-phosphoribosylamino)uracil reductase RibD [Coxiella endosymbiont of Amblyomma sculptum]QHG92351.1 bifunctional diaminohydroxyphosphoribosylaminopyrimidine deaminase/5-amino-6-(5-phosphoribosylamino)uracil reductase RibD [Coxiella endosymbiont of Amblyomma sculptum]
MKNPEIYLEQALKLAEIRRGFCAPNPAVGAVLVKDDQIISMGFHKKSGSPHAEVEAINSAGSSAKGANLYVTLEPCCHHGKTPPCTELIVKTGIKAVYYGSIDPNPNVLNKGAQTLQESGVDCFLIAVPKIRSFYESYTHWITNKKPWVTIKLAISLDGKISGAKGKPISLTGEGLKLYTHEFRRKSDALLTTINTVLYDNPQMNVRLANKIVKKPIYILDSNLSFPLDARIHRTAKKLTLFHIKSADKKRKKALIERNVHCIEIRKTKRGTLDLEEIIDMIGKNGIHDLWVESGGKCFQSFLCKKLVQHALIYIAPRILGAQSGSVFHMPFNFQGQRIQWHQIGEDAVCDIKFL